MNKIKSDALIKWGSAFVAVGSMIKIGKKMVGGSPNFSAEPVKTKHDTFKLPDLPFPYAGLEPIISDQAVKLHHDKHERGYINGMNKSFETLGRIRFSKYKPDARVPMRQSIATKNAFNISGSILHELYWGNLRGGGSRPTNELQSQIVKDFGSFDMFMQEFFDIAKSIPGNGWGVLVWSPELSKLVILPVQNHQLNWIPNARTLLVIDVWEHAYYKDYENRKGDYLKAIMNDINWAVVSQRFADGKVIESGMKFK